MRDNFYFHQKKKKNTLKSVGLSESGFLVFANKKIQLITLSGTTKVLKRKTRRGCKAVKTISLIQSFAFLIRLEKN